jgi:hypothetical protein
MNKLLLLLIGMLLAFDAQAVFMDGRKLLTFCQRYETSPSAEGVYCSGYVAAVVDVMKEDSIAGWKACTTGVAIDQAVRVVTKFLGDHPELLNYYGSSLTASALSEAFPCKQ